MIVKQHTRVTRRVPLVEQELLPFPEHLSSSCVVRHRSLFSVLNIVLSFFLHLRLWLSLWYLQTFYSGIHHNLHVLMKYIINWVTATFCLLNVICYEIIKFSSIDAHFRIQFYRWHSNIIRIILENNSILSLSSWASQINSLKCIYMVNLLITAKACITYIKLK